MEDFSEHESLSGNVVPLRYRMLDGRPFYMHMAEKESILRHRAEVAVQIGTGDPVWVKRFKEIEEHLKFLDTIA